jgi:predicted dehydrogenase
MIKSASAVAGFTIVPRYVLGGRGYVPPSDKILTACIGVGSQGTRVMLDFLRQPEIQIVALCDVNDGSDDYVEWWPNELRDKVSALLNDNSWARFTSGVLAGLEPSEEIVKLYSAGQTGKGSRQGCSLYKDYRELFVKEQSLDAVIVCTPDHSHAIICLEAMNLGKHVYCQKPMTHSVYEARQMAEVARKSGVATQVATGNSASEATRLLSEWIWDDAIGPVREVHNWSSRPFWPQGIERPLVEEAIPERLDWDLWLGPAPYRPYNSAYQPFVWRGWHDFGTAAVGDMGCYSFDTLFRVLKLEGPTQIQASSTKTFAETFPIATTLHFAFPARESLPPVTVHWYDGGLKPQKPEELGNQELEEEGLLFVGDKGKILCGFDGSEPRLIPDSAMAAYEPPAETLPRSIGHDEEWIAACKGGDAAAANFEFAGLVTETILLGNVAVRAGKTIEWNRKNFTIENYNEANDLLHPPYREGWSL